MQLEEVTLEKKKSDNTKEQLKGKTMEKIRAIQADLGYTQMNLLTKGRRMVEQVYTSKRSTEQLFKKTTYQWTNSAHLTLGIV